MARFTLLLKIFSLALTAFVAIAMIGYLAGHALMDNDEQHIRHVLQGALTFEASALQRQVSQEAHDFISPVTDVTSVRTDTAEPASEPDAPWLDHISAHFANTGISAVFALNHQRAIVSHQVDGQPIPAFAMEKLRFDLLPLINQAEKVPTGQKESFAAFVLLNGQLVTASVAPIQVNGKRAYLAALKHLDGHWYTQLSQHFDIPLPRFVAATPAAAYPDHNAIAIHGSYGGDIGWLVWPSPASNPLIHNLVVFGALCALILAVLSWIIFRRFSSSYTPQSSLQKINTRSLHAIDTVQAGLRTLLSPQRASHNLEELLAILERAAGNEYRLLYFGYGNEHHALGHAIAAQDLQHSVLHQCVPDPRYKALAGHLSNRAAPVGQLHETLQRREVYEVAPGGDAEWRAFFNAHRTGLLDDERIMHLAAYPVCDQETVLGGLVLLRLNDSTSSKWLGHLMQLFTEMIAVATQRESRPATGHLLTYLDPLTNLANRLQLHLNLEQACQLAQRQSNREALTEPMTLMQFSLSNAEALTAEFGHQIGDEVIKELAQRLSRFKASADTLARTGATEFTLLSASAQTFEDVVLQVQSAIESLSDPLFEDGITLYPKIHAGVARVTDLTASPEFLLVQCENARLQAQQSQDSLFHFSEPDEQAQALQCLQLLHYLPQALDRGDLSVRFLPLVDLRTHTLAGIEALVCLPHPSVSQMPAERVIRIAEATDEIDRLDLEVLRKASAMLKQLSQSGFTNLTLSMNVSGQSLLHPGMFPTMQEILTQKGVSPRSITLGLNEDWLRYHGKSIQTLSKQIVGSGMTFTVDKVHPRTTSISNLSLIPLQQLKLDRSAIEALAEDARQRREIQAVAALATTLDAEIVAVGVETHHQLKTLKEIGVHYAQGFLFGSPLEDKDLLSGLESLSLQLQQDFRQCPA